MTKVFHINSNYLTSRLHENLVSKLEEKGLDNTVYMPIKKEMEKEFLFQSDYTVHAPVAFNDWHKYVFMYKQRKIIKKMEELFHMEEYDICHAHTLFTDGNVAYYNYKKYGIPYIVTVRGFTDIEAFFKKRVNLRKRGREILKHASQVIFLSATNKKELLETYAKSIAEEVDKKSFVLPNGIDDFWFDHAYSPKTVSDPEKLKLIFVGKVNKRKNILKIIDAMRVLKKEHQQDASLTVVGRVDDQSVYETLTTTADVDVDVLPPKNREELLTHYRASDIFVMPSLHETFGLVYPEAMSQGLPVIYSKRQGFDGQFPEGTVGYAVESSDEHDIAKKIMEIKKRYEEISQNAVSQFTKFNWDDLSETYVKLYVKNQKNQN